MFNYWRKTTKQLSPKKEDCTPYKRYYITIWTVGGNAVTHAHYNYNKKEWYNENGVIASDRVIAWKEEKTPKPCKKRLDK